MGGLQNPTSNVTIVHVVSRKSREYQANFERSTSESIVKSFNGVQHRLNVLGKSFLITVDPRFKMTKRSG